MTATPCSPRLRTATLELCDSLVRMQKLHEELLTVLNKQEGALVEVRSKDLEQIREHEEEVLRKIVEEEKERLLLTEELGDMLDHEHPSEIRVAEILPHLPGELAVHLSGSREQLREAATKLARQNSINRALIEHSIGHIQIFISRLAAEESGGNQYTREGNLPRGDSDSFLFDRRI